MDLLAGGARDVEQVLHALRGVLLGAPEDVGAGAVQRGGGELVHLSFDSIIYYIILDCIILGVVYLLDCIILGALHLWGCGVWVWV